MSCTSARSLSFESSEMVNANLGTGGTVDTFLSDFDREGVGDGSCHDWIPDVAVRRFQGFDKKGKFASLNARISDAHQVLGSNAPAPASEAAEIAYKEKQEFSVGHDGGYTSLIHSASLSQERSVKFLFEPRRA